jgi:hypothetical protein
MPNVILTVEDYLDKLRGTAPNEKSRRLFDFYSKGHYVDVRPWTEHPAVRDLVTNFTRSFKAEKKQCYRNAIECSLFDADIELVEGFLSDLIPIEHAWNVHTPSETYFDLTLQHEEGRRYFEVVRLNQQRVRGYVLETEQYTSLMGLVARDSKHGAK